MSRIHDALHRAQQEVLPVQLGQTEAAGGNGTFVSSGVAPASASVLSRDFTADGLLEGCPKLRWEPDPNNVLCLDLDAQNPVTEQFRTLRSRLWQMRNKSDLKKVLITSALPKEGKSFVAANLAQVLSRQRRRTLLIDADLRRPRLHMVLGTKPSPGLSDYLQGNADEFSIMQQGNVNDLYFIPGGVDVSSPAELAASSRMGTLLDRVQALFDWIIIDSPPALPVADASLIAGHCQGVLMVVRSGQTSLDAAKKARQEFPDKSLLGVVLNATDLSFTYNWYYSAYFENNEGASSGRGKKSNLHQLWRKLHRAPRVEQRRSA